MDHEKYNKLKKVAKSGEIVRYPTKSLIWTIEEKIFLDIYLMKMENKFKFPLFLILILIRTITLAIKSRWNF